MIFYDMLLLEQGERLRGVGISDGDQQTERRSSGAVITSHCRIRRLMAMKVTFLASSEAKIQTAFSDCHPRCRVGHLQSSKLRWTSLFGKTFSTFTNLLKYQFKLLQFF